MQDFFKSIRFALFERLSSPLAGSFAMSWVVWNWRGILVLFFSKYYSSLDEIFQAIGTHTHWWTLWAGPLTTALLYVLVYPAITNQLSKATLWYKRQAKLIQNKIDMSELVTKEEYQQLIEDLQEEKAKHYLAIKERDDIIAGLRKENMNMNSIRINAVDADKDINTTRKYDLELKALRSTFEKLLDKNEQKGLISMLLSKNGVDIDNISWSQEGVIQYLSDKDYLYRSGEKYFALTDMGRSIITSYLEE